MYPVLAQDQGKKLFFRRVFEDYSNKLGVKYEDYDPSKVQKLKNTFVHNVIQNKTRVNFEHFENIYNKKVFTENKLKILK